MTVAERMRKDGWQHLVGNIWLKHMHGHTFVLCRDGDKVAPAGFSVDPYCDDGRDYGFGLRVGLRDLAQRAKAAARRLARKGKR